MGKPLAAVKNDWQRVAANHLFIQNTPNMIIRFTMLILSVIALSSCRTTIYTGQMGQGTMTQVELSEANFKVLGSFTGAASAKKVAWEIKNKTGIVSDAKADLLKNAEASGVKLTGSRALINITTDIIENPSRISCAMSAEIIEFQ